jgi:hypothetical protein
LLSQGQANGGVLHLDEGFAVDFGGLLKFVHRMSMERKPGEQSVDVDAEASDTNP